MIHPVECCCDPAPELATGLAHASVIFSTSGTPSSGILRTRAYNRTDVGTAVFNSTNYIIYDADRLGNMYQVVFTARTSVEKRDFNGSSVWTHAAAGSALYARLCVNRNYDVFTTQIAGSGLTSVTDVEKLNSSGSQQWITTLSGSGGINVSQIACDRDGNCFACGTQVVDQGGGLVDSNGWGAYLDASGTELWTIDALADLAGLTVADLHANQTNLSTPCFDAEGNVYFGISAKLTTGDAAGSATIMESLYKFDASGNEIWRKVINDTVNSFSGLNTISGMALDDAANLYIAWNGRDSAGNVIGLGLRRYDGPDQANIGWDFELSTTNNVGALALSKFGDLFVFTNPFSGNGHHRVNANDGTVIQSAAGAGASSGNAGLVCYPGRYPNF